MPTWRSVSDRQTCNPRRWNSISPGIINRKWAKACAEISTASRAPWILLSAAVDFQLYLRQVEIACRAGASGIAVGRAVWQEAVELRGAPRVDFLNNVARPRLERLAALCAEMGKPWTDFYAAPEIQPEWYKTY